jgi:CBS domain-containing protein
MIIAGILRGKGNRVIAVAPEEDVQAVAQTLADNRIGAVLVRDAAGAVLGILSERDIVRAVATEGAAALGRPAAALMTRDLHTATPHDSVVEALGQMTDRRIRHLPVMEDGRLAGMVSIGDLVKARIGEVEEEAESLRSFVVSGG